MCAGVHVLDFTHVWVGVCMWKKPGHVRQGENMSVRQVENMRMRQGENMRVRQRAFLRIYFIYLFIFKCGF